MLSPLAVSPSNRTHFLADRPLDSRRGTSPMTSNSFLAPSHAVSFENMLRQFRKLSAPSCNSSLPQSMNYPLVHLESVGPNCIPRSANSQPPSPLACLGAPFIPVSCQMSNSSDITIPAYHRFHNDSHLNLSPASSGTSEGLSLPSCEFPASRSLFEQFRNTRSRVLLVSALVLRVFQCLINRFKLQKDRRWPLSSFVAFFTEVSATPLERRRTC